jgi:hypothetical protein
VFYGIEVIVLVKLSDNHAEKNLDRVVT